MRANLAIRVTREERVQRFLLGLHLQQKRFIANRSTENRRAKYNQQCTYHHLVEALDGDLTLGIVQDLQALARVRIAIVTISWSI